MGRVRLPWYVAAIVAYVSAYLWLFCLYTLIGRFGIDLIEFLGLAITLVPLLSCAEALMLAREERVRALLLTLVLMLLTLLPILFSLLSAASRLGQALRS